MPKHNKPRFSPKEILRPLKHKFKPHEAGFYKKHPEFSFKHYQHNHKKYSAKCIIDYQDFHIMFERLKSMSQLKWKDIKHTHMFHFHPIEWGKTSEPKGFKLIPSDLNEAPAWQFKSFKECRMIGFFNQDNVFELVWVDRDHGIYPHK